MAFTGLCIWLASSCSLQLSCDASIIDWPGASIALSLQLVLRLIRVRIDGHPSLPPGPDLAVGVWLSHAECAATSVILPSVHTC